MPMSYSKTCDNKCKYNEFWNKILEDFLSKLKKFEIIFVKLSGAKSCQIFSFGNVANFTLTSKIELQFKHFMQHF